jgi:hypothetical protein
LRPGGILEAFWAKAILLGCPWGIYPQGPVDGNEAQRHLATFYPDWFERLAYTVECTGKPDKPSGNLAAWRMREAP